MSKSRFRKRSAANEDMVLQITSMADIFTIILVFLLKSYATGVSTVSSSPSLSYAQLSKLSLEIRETAKVEITSDSILVEDKVALSLNKFFLPAQITADVAESYLGRYFVELRKSGKLKQNESNLIVISDARTPYTTLKRLLNAAAMTGFVDLQFIMMEEEK